MATIGQLEIQLLANVARLQSDMDKATRTVTGAMGSIDKAVGTAQKAFGALGIGISALSFGSLVKDALNFADKMNDVAKANDVAVGSILKLSQALSLNGGEADSASKVFSALTNSIDEAASGSEKTQAKFKLLGVSLDDLRKLDNEALFNKTLAGLKDIEDPIKRNATAMDLLGKAVKGVDIAGLGNDFADNDADFTNAEKSFKEIGVAMDKLDILTTKASRSLAELFAPALTTSVELLDRFVFGYSRLENNIRAANKARAEADGVSPFKSAPRIGDKPALGAFNLPADYQAVADKREVIDTAAINRNKAAATAAAREAEKRLKAEQDAIKKIAEEREKYSVQERKDWLEEQKYEYDTQVKNEKEIYEEKLKNMELLARASNERFEEERRNQEELLREKKRMNDEFSRSLTDALFRGFESGKSFLKNFRDTVINAFQTLILRPRIEAIVSASGLGAAFSPEALASGGSGGGIGGLFSSVKSFFSGGNGSIVSAIEGFGSTIANGLGGIRDTIGGFVGANAGMIANVSSFAGAALSLLKGDLKGAAFQGGGAAIGLALGGPIGGAIGSFLGGAIGGLFGGKKQPPRTVTQLPEVGGAFSSSINALLGGFGINGNASATASYRGRKGGSGYGLLNTNIGGVANTIENRDKDNYGEESMKAFVNKVLGVDLVKAIQSSKLSAGVKKFFDGLTDPQIVNQSIASLIGLNSALKDMPPIFDAVRNAIDTTAYKVSVAQLEATFANTATFTSLFYTEAENFALFTKQLQSQLTSLNTVLPTSRDAYRQLVDGIKVNSEATFNQYSGLVALAPAMDAYFKQLQVQADASNAAADGISAMNRALADALDKNLYSTFADYASAQANVSNGLSGAAFLANGVTPQGNADLLQAIRELREAQANTTIVLEAIAAYTYDSAKTQKQWNNDGLPAVRVI